MDTSRHSYLEIQTRTPQHAYRLIVLSLWNGAQSSKKVIIGLSGSPHRAILWWPFPPADDVRGLYTFHMWHLWKAVEQLDRGVFVPVCDLGRAWADGIKVTRYGFFFTTGTPCTSTSVLICLCACFLLLLLCGLLDEPLYRHILTNFPSLLLDRMDFLCDERICPVCLPWHLSLIGISDTCFAEVLLKANCLAARLQIVRVQRNFLVVDCCCKSTVNTQMQKTFQWFEISYICGCLPFFIKHILAARLFKVLHLWH